MEESRIAGAALPAMPWEERPAGCKDVVWRCPTNPVIPRDLLPASNSIFNSAVVPLKSGYVGVFHCGGANCHIRLHIGFSKDVVRWDINEEPLKLQCDDAEIGNWTYGYNPKVCFVEDRYYATWRGDYHGPTIDVAYTYDFVAFHQLESASVPFNWSGVLFPRKINDRFVMSSRPGDNGHTPLGGIFYSESPDMELWGRHRRVISPVPFEDNAWQCTKIDVGPIPIEISEGWLLICHGVLASCNDFVYSLGSTLFDLDEPWKVKLRSRPYLISSQREYEYMSDVSNIYFPCAVLHDLETGRVTTYYGCADTVTGLASGYIPEIIEFIKHTSII